MLSVNDKNTHFLILERGEKFIATITAYCVNNKLKGAFFKAIGALENVELGYYDLHNKNYIRKTFDESDYELVSAHGNLTVKAGESYVHIHASLSGADFQVFGGHLFEAEVAVTAEVQITIFDVQSIRQPDQKIGLDLVCQFHKS